MSYDLRLAVKTEYGSFVEIGAPDYDSPTYNLGEMFRACTGWDYNQGEYYKCSEVIDKIEHGIRELTCNRSEYLQYNPPNGWGDLPGALMCLISLRDYIYERGEDIPLEYLYVAW